MSLSGPLHAAYEADPKPILGYSDISLPHLVRHARTGLVGFHTDLAADLACPLPMSEQMRGSTSWRRSPFRVRWPR